ncbi:retinol-binding protein 1 isoform X1 [Austrofundulus limnaeus]|uniref:Retinol-binding protein 1 isoform X1 n=1 Tax=Austrofundulus limnaeus TaxID=52670 RepID=A0A2I4BH46_AUSLI|nr:PREDICTED: retinol-binding protein 1 isoform X1 [Austrofundulus limnaeus]XP_013867061.1 PREDICTED: retinol-binding protein 1 isoform X1 [Austrofundulus limnaeus]XP_013867062.1 PREDICTED: retinol-binding protein 1 isoform X1 [Austrofundulus limnaeus]
MPVDLNGYWKMVSNDNFEEYMKALDVNVAIRKIANLLKPDKDIVHDGDHMVIKTLSTFKNYNMDFYVGKEFEEDLCGVDDRKCMQEPLQTAVMSRWCGESRPPSTGRETSWCVFRRERLKEEVGPTGWMEMSFIWS